jgi:hypothetical protein
MRPRHYFPLDEGATKRDKDIIFFSYVATAKLFLLMNAATLFLLFHDSGHDKFSLVFTY